MTDSSAIKQKHEMNGILDNCPTVTLYNMHSHWHLFVHLVRFNVKQMFGNKCQKLTERIHLNECVSTG